MKENSILIPSAIESVIDPNIQALINKGLKKEVAIFLLGSLVYQTPCEQEYRSFASFAKEVNQFDAYLALFLENGILKQEGNNGLFRYNHDIDHERFLEPYEFDSITVLKIIQQEFKNNVTHFENAYRFRFLKSGLKDFYPPF